MNRDIFGNEWYELRDPLKDWWGRLTDRDLAQIDGNYDRLVEVLQEKYGYSRGRAERDVNRWLAQSQPLERKRTFLHH